MNGAFAGELSLIRITLLLYFDAYTEIWAPIAVPRPEIYYPPAPDT